MDIGWRVVKTMSRLHPSWRANVKQYENFFRREHYYSPIPRIDDVRRNEARIFNRQQSHLAGIDLNVAGQLDVLKQIQAFYGELPFPERQSPGRRYCLDNKFFPHADAIVYYGLIRLLRPGRIIEVGSGFSSAVALDTNELFFGGAIRNTFIEPDTQRLDSLLKPEDRTRIDILPRLLQEVPLEQFETLAAGDILFIDSSHVSKVGSDVNRLLFEVLPALRSGVYIHFHDIFYPFEYPKDWIYRGVAWNEAYVLRAFLQYNAAFRIVIWPDYLQRFHEHEFRSALPRASRGSGSLWMCKT